MRGVITGSLCALLLFAPLGCKRLQEGGRAEQKSLVLFEELHALPAPSASQLIVEERFSKWGLATASAKFATNAPWSEITSFYQAELARHGWKLKSTTIDREWGKDLGGRTYIFCRDD